MSSKSGIKLLALLALSGCAAWQVVDWSINRIFVPPGKSLLLRYKGPLLLGRGQSPQPGQLARREPLEVGVLREMPGPGRHFYCPLWWERTLVEDVVVEPGELAVVTSLVGSDPAVGEGPLGDSQFLVEGELGETTSKGTLRRVYGPGRYRVNPYGYEVKKIKGQADMSGRQVKQSGWVRIETGHVGVVTNQTDNPRTGARQGIQPEPLPPGLYAVNPREQQVDVIPIGYREKTLQSEPREKTQQSEPREKTQHSDPREKPQQGGPREQARPTESRGVAAGQAANLPITHDGEPDMDDAVGGIVFPSKDGFTIHMDFTAIWGILPAQAPRVVEFSGNLEAVEQRVVVPLIESICRNEGSKLGAVELLVGETREKFQDETTQQFETRLRETGVALQYGLVRHIYIPREVRLPIQQKYLADELTLTRDQEQLTARMEADLREQERTVDLESERIKVETEKLVAEKQAEGKKTAAETRAETNKQLAALDRETAELERKAKVLLGEAEAAAQQRLEEAKAERFQLAVEAFGTPEAFNQWVFATGLPDDLNLQMLYAGEGTFWTDLKGFEQTLLGRQAAREQSPPSMGNPATNPSRK
ncbi:MAG: SPFH domain-containing protein [Planctomycetaceae bacterium]